MPLLRDNLQPTDFADADCRVTDWVEVEARPEWQESQTRSYRIWVCRCGAYWFQRHEWMQKGANRSTLDDWIFSGYWPRRSFETHYKPAPNMEDV